MAKKPQESVSVVGLGKLGLCLAAVLASKGYRVFGVEIDESKVASVNSGKSPLYEPGLGELIKRNHSKLSASTGFKEAIAKSSVTFVVVPTPSDDSGGFSLRFVLPAMKSIGKELRKKAGYHLVVLTSTVMPGSMDDSVRPTLEAASGKRCGVGFGLCYNPEFIALGDVIKGMLKPDFILIGESDARAGRLLAKIQGRMCDNSPPMERMSFVNAELSKIAVNSYVTMKMTFANTLAEIAERIPGGDVDRITSAIGNDRRIGRAYLKGALGYAGPCFPRDNVAFAKFAETVGAQARLAQTTHSVNEHQVERLLALAKRRGLGPGDRVGILGLSYKPRTNIVDESQAIALASDLRATGHEVTVYDPAAIENARQILGHKVSYATSAIDCLRRSDFVILATPWEEFSKIGASHFKGKTVLDCWRVLGAGARRASNYVPLGEG